MSCTLNAVEIADIVQRKGDNLENNDHILATHSSNIDKQIIFNVKVKSLFLFLPAHAVVAVAYFILSSIWLVLLLPVINDLLNEVCTLCKLCGLL